MDALVTDRFSFGDILEIGHEPQSNWREFCKKIGSWTAFTVTMIECSRFMKHRIALVSPTMQSPDLIITLDHDCNSEVPELRSRTNFAFLWRVELHLRMDLPIQTPFVRGTCNLHLHLARRLHSHSKNYARICVERGKHSMRLKFAAQFFKQYTTPEKKICEFGSEIWLGPLPIQEDDPCLRYISWKHRRIPCKSEVTLGGNNCISG